LAEQEWPIQLWVRLWDNLFPGFTIWPEVVALTTAELVALAVVVMVALQHQLPEWLIQVAEVGGTMAKAETVALVDPVW